jgi:hypothetical protein
VPEFWREDRLWKFARESVVPHGAIGINTVQALYHFNQIDPNVLSAIDRIFDPSKVNSYDEILTHLASKKADGATAWQGAISKYKGELGEKLMSMKLEAAGHLVVLAESTNQEGWDCLVDGEKVNFKVGLNPNQINEHLERFPDVQVITVSEHSLAFQDNPDVICLEDVSGEQIQSITESAMSSSLDSTAFGLKIPLLTLALSAIKHFSPVLKGHSKVSVALQYTAADTVGVGMGVAAGAKAGAIAGSFGGPLLAAVGGILGGLGGALGGRWLAAQFKERDLNVAVKTLEVHVANHAKAYIRGLHNKKSALLEMSQKITRSFSLYRFFVPTPGDVWRSEIRYAYQKWASSCAHLAEKLEKESLGDVNDGYLKLGRRILSQPLDEPVFSAALSRLSHQIADTCEKIDMERKRLGYT